MSKGHPGQEKGYHTQGSVYCIYIFIIVLVKLVCLLCTERKFQTSVASRLASLFHLMILLFRGHGIKFHEIQKSGQGWQRGRCLIDFVAFSKSRHDCCPAIPHHCVTCTPYFRPPPTNIKRDIFPQLSHVFGASSFKRVFSFIPHERDS